MIRMIVMILWRWKCKYSYREDRKNQRILVGYGSLAETSVLFTIPLIPSQHQHVDISWKSLPATIDPGLLDCSQEFDSIVEEEVTIQSWKAVKEERGSQSRSIGMEVRKAQSPCRKQITQKESADITAITTKDSKVETLALCFLCMRVCGWGNSDGKESKDLIERVCGSPEDCYSRH